MQDRHGFNPAAKRSLEEHDKWKKDFLKEIREEFADKVLKIDGDSKYRLIGVPSTTTKTKTNSKIALRPC
jgi:hypothetical protein